LQFEFVIWEAIASVITLNIYFSVTLCFFEVFLPLLLWINDKLECFISRNLAQLAKVKVMKRPGSQWEELQVQHR